MFCRVVSSSLSSVVPSKMPCFAAHERISGSPEVSNTSNTLFAETSTASMSSSATVSSLSASPELSPASRRNKRSTLRVFSQVTNCAVSESDIRAIIIIGRCARDCTFGSLTTRTSASRERVILQVARFCGKWWVLSNCSPVLASFVNKSESKRKSVSPISSRSVGAVSWVSPRTARTARDAHFVKPLVTSWAALCVETKPELTADVTDDVTAATVETVSL
mmetsp:Transcript_13780/g.45569  ORF Transcript_13780/g.45569 Transcript_13780/m.45569 type:complete len:221 (+) Transcript_13780:1626-2288(+)